MRRKLSNLSTYCLHCPLTPAWPRSCPELDKETVVGLHQLQLAQLGGHQQTMERTISRSAHTIKVGTAAQLQLIMIIPAPRPRIQIKYGRIVYF